jgi:MFS family permease
MPHGTSSRQIWVGLVLLLVLGSLLVADKIADGWDARQWLIVGAIILWVLGPATAGGILGAHLFSRFRSPRTAQVGAAGLALGSALLVATVTVVIAELDTWVQSRPGVGRPPFASDLGLILGIQTMVGSVLAGYFARHAAYLQARHRGKDEGVDRGDDSSKPAEPIYGPASQERAPRNSEKT